MGPETHIAAFTIVINVEVAIGMKSSACGRLRVVEERAEGGHMTHNFFFKNMGNLKPNQVGLTHDL